MKLLFRAYKKDDEFIRDYVERIGKCNGYLKPKIFDTLLRKYFDNDYGRYFDCLNEKAVPRLALESIFRRNISIDESYRYTHAKRYIWAKSPGGCTKCKSEDSYTRFYWWLAGYQRCHIHGELIFSEKLESKSAVEFTESFSPGKLIGEIVQFYADNASIQSSVLNEIERYYLDHSIAVALLKNFREFGISGDADKVILGYLWSTDILGAPACIRIQNMARIFSRYVGSENFWLRMIALTFESHTKGALSYKGHWFKVNEEYRRYRCFLMGVDAAFRDVLPVVSGFRKRDQMSGVCISKMLDGLSNPSIELIDKIKMSIFSLRHIGTWVLGVQKADEFWDKKTPKQFYWSLQNRLL